MILRLLVAVFSGVMIFASFEPTGLWWAAPLGFALLFYFVDHPVSYTHLRAHET